MKIEEESLELRNSLQPITKQKIKNIEEKIAPALSKTTAINYEFTEHGLEHSRSVEKIYDILLSENKEVLNETEKFILICATLFHDIGMVGEAKHARRKDYDRELRDYHHTNAKQIIDKIYNIVGLDAGMAEYIGVVAEAHRSVALEDLDESCFLGAGISIRLRLLGALLRFADELHLTYDRSDDVIRKIIKPGLESMVHHQNHLAIQGIGKVDRNINVNATATLWKVESGLRKIENSVNQKLQECQDIFKKNNVIIDKVNFVIKNNEIIRKEIILLLAEESNLNNKDLENKLKERFNRDYNKLDSQLKSLLEQHIINEPSQSTYSIIESFPVFEKLQDALLDTDYELEFVQSQYVKNFLINNLREFICEKFACQFKLGEFDDRLLVLTSSPTALRYVFSDKHLRCQSGIIDKQAIFDLSILQGYTVDSILYPSIAESSEVRFAIQAINLHMSDVVNNFVRLIGALPSVIEKKKII